MKRRTFMGLSGSLFTAIYVLVGKDVSACDLDTGDWMMLRQTVDGYHCECRYRYRNDCEHGIEVDWQRVYGKLSETLATHAPVLFKPDGGDLKYIPYGSNVKDGWDLTMLGYRR